jgi:non-specific serine/threonine protein kinase/serine/threonine-protein kinase
MPVPSSPAGADWRRVKEVYEAALERPPAERAWFLRERCGSDGELLREVESLVAAHDEAGGFLETPAALPEEPARVGRRFGPYRVVAEIGRGGMGTVFRAVREDDAFRKEVALKLVRAAGGDLGTSRFRRERHILARLQHPNIATLYDGGTSEEGQPFLVMELVEGQPLDRHCAAAGLGARERIALFRVICAAVHHAHQALVVHRDIKPTNILVTAEGVPKLLDFGIAKLLAVEEDGSDGAPTATMLPLLTPEYASPEQVRGEPITTASDVYSLGVVLYELLAGRRPYELGTRALEEVLRVVGESEPRRPSDVAEGTASARQLAGDLDTIVLKCLSKEPARRYASARELSDDLQRYLDGRPLLARPDTLRYRATKFVRRHRFAVVSSAIAVLGLVIGTVVAWRQAALAEANRQRAERRFQDVRTLASSLLFDLHDEIVNLPGSLKARQALVTKAEQYLETLSREAAGDAGLQRELAAAYQRLGDLQGSPRTANAGDSDGALRSYRKALALREPFGRRPDADARDVEALAFLQFAIGALHRARAESQRSQVAFEDAVGLVEPLVASGRASSDLRGRLAGFYQMLSEVQARNRQADAANASAARGVELAESYAKDHPASVDGRVTLAATYLTLAARMGERGELRGALERLHQARAIQEALRAEQPLNMQHVRGLGFTLDLLGSDQLALGDMTGAVRTRGEGVALAESMVRADPDDRYARVARGVSGRALGATLVAAGDAPAGIARLREARDAIDAVLREDPANGFAREELLGIDHDLGRALLAAKAPAARAEGCAALGRALAGWSAEEAEGALPSDAEAALNEVRTLVARCAPASAASR